MTAVPEIMFGFDGGADDAGVVVAERTPSGWRIIGTTAAGQMPAPMPAGLPVHRWSEDILTHTAAGWMTEHSEGSFQLSPWQVEVMAATYARLVREGRVVHEWSTAGLR